jgi:hypothetical protein
MRQLQGGLDDQATSGWTVVGSGAEVGSGLLCMPQVSMSG